MNFEFETNSNRHIINPIQLVTDWVYEYEIKFLVVPGICLKKIASTHEYSIFVGYLLIFQTSEKCNFEK